MTKWLLVPILLLAVVGLAPSLSRTPQKLSLGMTALAAPFQTPSPITTPAAKACPSACSAQLTATEGKIEALQAQVNQLRDAMNHDIPILDERALDLYRRLQHFENQEKNGLVNKAMLRIMAELNDVDARVAQLERPEVEDDAK